MKLFAIRCCCDATAAAAAAAAGVASKLSIENGFRAAATEAAAAAALELLPETTLGKSDTASLAALNGDEDGDDDDVDLVS